MMHNSHARDKKLICGWLAACLGLANVTVSAGTYYVRSSGSDSNTGTNAGKAFKTINKAASMAKANDKVYVGAGTYSETVNFTYDGTSTQPIEVIADTDGTFTGDAGTVTVTAAGSPVFNINADHYITLDGFLITGGTNGVYVNSSNGALIKNCTVQASSSHGINVNSSQAKIEKSIVKNTGANGIYGNASMINVVNCLVLHAGLAGVSVNSVSGASTIWHTTIYGSGDEGVTLNSGGGSLSVYNCIIAESGDDGIERSGSTLNHDYNIVYNNHGGNYDGVSQTSHELTINPLFVSTTDFHLQPSSPGIGAGTNLGVTEDMDGNSIPGGSTTIGSYWGTGPGGGGSGSEYFVRLTGNDSNHGKSKTLSFRTLAKAATVVAPGNTVWVGAGVYPEAPNLASKLGTVEQPIQFNADTDGAMTGDAGTVTVQGGFYLQNSSYVTIKGFAIQPGVRKAAWSSDYAAAHLSGCSNVLFDQLTSTGGDYGFLADNSATTNATTCVASSAVVHGFCFQGSTTGTITGCQANSNSQAGFYVTQGTVDLSGCTSTGNGTHGFRYNAARGTLSGCSSTGDYLGAALLGVNNDRTTVTATNLTIQSSQNGGALLQVCTAQLLAGAQPLSSSGTYGAYVDNANLTLTNGVIRNTQYGVQVFNGGSATLSGCTISNCIYEGLSATASTATLSGCSLTSCRDGIRGSSNSLLTATSCTVSGNRGWGINLAGRGAIDGCTFANNYQGVFLTGQTTRGDVTISNTTIDNTTREGLVAIRCAGNASGAVNKLSKGGNYGVYVDDSNLTLSNFQIQGPDYGITAYGSQLALSGGTISNSPFDGIYVSNCQTTLASCAISSCRYGIRSENGGNLSVDNSTLDTNSSWAIVHSGYGSVTNSTLTNNHQGLHLVGAVATGDITLDNTKVQGTTAEGLILIRCGGNIPAGTDKISQGGSYGVYLDECDVVMTAPDILGPQYGFLCYRSTLAVSDAVVGGCSIEGIHAESSTLNLTGGTLSGNAVGLYSYQNPTVNITGTNISNNTSWGAAVYASPAAGAKATFSGCTIGGNAGGIAVTDATSGSFELLNTTIQNNTQDGLRFENCNLALDNQATGNWQLLNNPYGINSHNSTLTLNGLTLSGSSTAAVYAFGGNLTVSNSTLSGSGYGIWANTANAVVMDACTLSGNTAGLYSNQATSLVATNSTFTGNTQWGAMVTPKASAGLSVVFEGCTFHSNAGGLTLVNAGDGQVSLRTGTLIRDNTAAGLHFDNSNLTLNDQAGGANWRTLRNQRGISVHNSTLALTNVRVENSSSYGVYCEDSAVSLVGCTVTGDYGIYADAANNSLIVHASRFDASSQVGVGLARYGGIVDVKNTIFNGYASGMFLSTSGNDPATVSNTTIANAATFGIHVSQGDATVRNTIVAGSNAAGVGIFKGYGQLTHTNNLIHGFATLLSGTSANSTELQRDPRFVSAVSGDLRLAAGSPAINAGMDLSSSLATDIAGNARPSFQTYDIGAYEYVSPSGSLRILSWQEKK